MIVRLYILIMIKNITLLVISLNQKFDPSFNYFYFNN